MTSVHLSVFNHRPWWYFFLFLFQADEFPHFYRCCLFCSSPKSPRWDLMNFRIFFLLYPQLVVTVTEHYPIFQVKSGLDLISLSRSAGSQRVNFFPTKCQCCCCCCCCFFNGRNADIVVFHFISFFENLTGGWGTAFEPALRSTPRWSGEASQWRCCAPLWNWIILLLKRLEGGFGEDVDR